MPFSLDADKAGSGRIGGFLAGLPAAGADGGINDGREGSQQKAWTLRNTHEAIRLCRPASNIRRAWKSFNLPGFGIELGDEVELVESCRDIDIVL